MGGTVRKGNGLRVISRVFLIILWDVARERTAMHAYSKLVRRYVRHRYTRAEEFRKICREGFSGRKPLDQDAVKLCLLQVP